MNRQAIEEEIQNARKRAEEGGWGWEPPKWLVGFLADPKKAVSDALSHRYDFGQLSPEEPEDILTTWAETLGPEFRKALYQEVRQWIHVSHLQGALLILGWVGPDGTYEPQHQKAWWRRFRKHMYMWYPRYPRTS
ncbi:MAG: hypothetical protein A2Z24_01665 [Candidatus Woykebacteria bacterium RBG_16_44_10]|uniref:Uncharacterized protein n=1 Tax=Candidatus Woykebacteria bacterium RBG_16_44_10 TaxID=1802597 RepID=A0A1G1WF36_9BACT|nr:MAG: hypothetical protein A2Z24_01665 [Candidatus Woykebacteria bacterium RBG_16_44_10]